MTETLTLSLIEIMLLMFGAIILGITIHFFISSRRTLNAASKEMQLKKEDRDEWKLRYFNDVELRDKDISDLKFKLKQTADSVQSVKDQLRESEENTQIYMTEADEVRKNNKQLKAELLQVQQAGGTTQTDLRLIETLRNDNERLQEELELARLERDNMHSSLPLKQEDSKPDYIRQLEQAQHSLLEHNQKINALLGNIDVIKEKEVKEREILHDKEVLAAEVDHMREELFEKEREISNIREKEKITVEMSSMLDNAYQDFQSLQEKIAKLESQLSSSRAAGMELDDLREEHINLHREVENHRNRANMLAGTNQQLQDQVHGFEDQLREANFQRQQLQKRVAYLEELNNDLQVVSDANKKLEHQLRRIGELESMLNVVSTERDHLATSRNGHATSTS